jgi:methyl-accepting chemotaxis protein
VFHEEEGMPRPNVFKRTYLINKPLQIKYALIIGGVLIVMLVLVQIHTYLTIQSILPNLFSSVLGKQVRTIQFWLAVNSLIYVAVVGILSVFLSHKIAGPIYRFETAIQEVLDSGDSTKRIALRKGDELHSLADRLNRLLEKFSRSPRA